MSSPYAARSVWQGSHIKKSRGALLLVLASGLCLIGFYANSVRYRGTANTLSTPMGMPAPDPVQLPHSLESLVLDRFDAAVKKGDVMYDDSETEYLTKNGFNFQFRIAPMLASKPVTAPDDPGRTKPVGPFANPPEDEIVTRVGSRHNLLINKYSYYRPMLVLPTIEYERQSEALNEYDIEAAWAVLKAFKTPHMILYNGGVNAGSSQGHKHLQIVPLPSGRKGRLFPSYAQSIEIIDSKLANVPFKHFALRLPTRATSQDVYRQYRRLLKEALEALAAADAGTDHNVIISSDWAVVIPRRPTKWGGPYGSNALGMVGMVTVPSQKERDRWTELGYADHLRTIGIPRDFERR